MARPRRHSPARESRKRWLAIVGIALFIALDILLVVLALQSTSPRDNGSTSADASTSTPSTPPATPSSTPTPSASEPSTVTAVAPTRILSALDASTAWRATTGSCPDAMATPELTTDAGATWSSADVTGATGVTALQRILVSDADTASFLGSDAECAPEMVRTFVAGTDFAESPDELDSVWHLAPVAGDTVHAPSGDVAAPCASAVMLAPLDDARAAVLCSDSSVHATVDSGTTWEALDGPAGAIALTESADGFLVVSAGTAACAGVTLTSVGIDDTRSSLGCIESPVPSEELAGSTAIDWTEAGIWIWVDDRLLISTDEGESWS